VIARVLPNSTLWLGGLSVFVLTSAGATLLLSAAPVHGPPPASGELGPSDAPATYHAGEAVEAFHAGRWYAARIHAVGSDRFFVTYEGFSVSWHEWVDGSRLRRGHETTGEGRSARGAHQPSRYSARPSTAP
jgi:hypothetical protein